MICPSTNEAEVVASSLDAALRQVEQRCQEIRWRLNAFPANVAVEDLEGEINDFTVEAFHIARLFGGMSVDSCSNTVRRQQSPG